MYAFLFSDDTGVEVIIKLPDTGLPWVDLTEYFFNFLQATGYSLTREDFADHVEDNFR